MLADLAALTPPVIVCVAVLIGTWAIVRRELAPKRRQRAETAVPSEAADEDRAVDPERGRSLYSRHRRFIWTPRSGYVLLRRASSLSRTGRSARREIASMASCVEDDNVRLGDMLTVYPLSLDVSACWPMLASCGFRSVLSLHSEVSPPGIVRGISGVYVY